MLPRELIRQAVLIAARDELGLHTRDQVIDQTRDNRGNPAAEVLEVISYVRDNRSREQIRQLGKESIQTLFAHETPMAPGRSLELNKLLSSAEVLSREEFPAVLEKGLGLNGKPNATKAEAGFAAEIEEQLGSLSYVNVLLAVRALHRAIRDDGESPQRIGALVRGYALLGVLSEYEWNPAHRAFKARALLYAQRLVARNRESPWGLWHRAFAWALVGRHVDALADLAAAKLKTPGKNAPEAPAWLELVDAFSHFDSARLAQNEGPKNKLAALLCMLTLSYPRNTAIGLSAAKDVAALESDCFLAHDAMCEFFGVSTQHMTTMIAQEALRSLVFNTIPTLDGIPRNLKDQLDENSSITKAAELFDQAGAPEADLDEPSLGAAARMIRETRFVQVFRRLYFMKVLLSMPTDELWDEVRQDVADHPYAGYLESLLSPKPESAARYLLFADGLDLTDIETTESAMNRSLWNLERPKAKAAWNVARCHEDETAEMAASLWNSDEQNKLALAREILKISPFHAYARAVLINKDWENVKGEVTGWEKESGVSPAVLAVLGTRYTSEKKFDDAERVLSRYIILSPDRWAYRALADNYKAQGDIDRWQKTLDEFLNKVEDLGLDHAQVQVEIANFYAGVKQWEKARPYAEAAAATWAEWAMICAARCAEGEKDWARAELWFSRVTERYPGNSWAVWYFFCKRTGQGNLAAARDAVERYLTSRADARIFKTRNMRAISTGWKATSRKPRLTLPGRTGIARRSVPAWPWR